MVITKKINELIAEYGLCLFVIKSMYKIIWWIANKLICVSFGIKDHRIIFESGSDFSDNGRALFEYLIQNKYNDKYQLVWLVSDPRKFEKHKRKNVLFVKSIGIFHGYHTIKALYYVRTSKILFFTHSTAWIIRKRRCQLLINLWHGCGYKAAKGGSENIIFDYCLVPGKIFIETKMKFFGCSAERILPLGYPRYDWFKSTNPLILKYIVALNKRDVAMNSTILWMPTFRRTKDKALCENTLDSSFDFPILSTIKELEELNTYCKDLKINLIIKRHHLQIEYEIGNSNPSNIFFLTDDKLSEIDIQLYELLGYVDGLITDYSSVAIDFLLLDKPIGFTLDDYEKYKNSRGFVFNNPLEYMPGHHIFSLSDLQSFLKDVANGYDYYKVKRSGVRNITHNQSDDYCKKVLEYFNI